MRRLTALLAVMLLAFGLVGCGGQEKQKGNEVKILPKPTQQTLSIDSIEKLHDGLLGDISPDGSRLLLAWDQGKPDPDPADEMAPLWSLHQFNLADGGVEQISQSEIHQANGQYSPDGKNIAFTENAEESFRVYVMENKPHVQKKLVSKPGDMLDANITWSPDSKTFAVAYFSPDPANPGKIVFYDAQGNEKHTFKQGEGKVLFPQFIDNNTLLYTSNIGDAVKVMALNINNINQPKEIATGMLAKLSPDKRSLSYFVRQGDKEQLKIKVNAIDTDLQIGTTLAEHAVEDDVDEIAWSPDSRYLVYGGGESIWALDTKDGEKQQLASDMWSVNKILWDENEGIVFSGISKESKVKDDYTFSTYRIKLK